MTHLPAAPFLHITELPGPTGAMLSCTYRRKPTTRAVVSPTAFDDAGLLIVGLGRQRDARVLGVSTAWHYRKRETFERLQALFPYKGELLVFHTAYGVGTQTEAAIRAAARDAVSEALVGDSWEPRLYPLDDDDAPSDEGTQHLGDTSPNVEPLTLTKIKRAVLAARELLHPRMARWPAGAYTFPAERMG